MAKNSALPILLLAGGDEVDPIVRGQVGTGLANWDMILR